jgi:hypothetical protein
VRSTDLPLYILREHTSGYPPEPYVLDGYLALLAEEAPDGAWMVS